MEAKPPNVEPPKRKRRWFQFHLRTLLIVVTLLAAPLGYVGWQAKIVRERHDLLKRLVGMGGLSINAEQAERLSGSGLAAQEIAHRPATQVPWIRRLLGDETIAFLVLPSRLNGPDVEEIIDAFPEAAVKRVDGT